MPDNDPFPPIAIGAQFDSTTYTGDLFTLGGVAVPLVSIATPARTFRDVLEMLTGRGVETPYHGGNDFAFSGAPGGQIDSASTGIRDWYVGIDADDRFYVENRGAPADPFVVDPKANINIIWGIDDAGQASVASGGGTIERVTGSADWRRGVIGLSSDSSVITITPTASAFFLWPLVTRGLVLGEIPRFLRRHDEGDLDAGAVDDNLEARCRTLVPGSHIRWGVDANGHVYCQVPNAEAVPVWGATAQAVAFRNHLGYDGTETVSVVLGGTTDVLRANNPARGFLVASRGLKRLVRSRQEDTATARLATGQPLGNSVSRWGQAAASFWLGGPSQTLGWPQGAAGAYGSDVSEHWLDLISLLPKAAPMTIYQQWGDPRRRATQLRTAAYSKLQTTELNGRRGRLSGWRSPADSAQQWDPDGELMVRAEVQIVMDLEDGS